MGSSSECMVHYHSLARASEDGKSSEIAGEASFVQQSQDKGIDSTDVVVR